ncbi:MAG: hypothetical protein N3D82_00320 [Ignisphaera sp.]|nr:hypothetical protein [Ignisphaera sp.]MCX8167460.1 hypothetical protein [Ignisphaera sp.]MDW8084676.1 hypothetical protein [Ignisphaera sp.]
MLCSETLIVEKLAKKLLVLGYDVYSNFRFMGLEFDVMAVELSKEFWRPLVHIFEVKVRAKPKIVDQIEKRLGMADYLYIVVPYGLYPWILRKINNLTGVIIYKDDDLYVFKTPVFIGNGYRILMRMRYFKEQTRYTD